VGAIKEGHDVVGNRTRVKVVKNKIAPPFKEVEFDVVYGRGISREGDLLDLAVSSNVIERSGTWYSYNGERLGQGRENAKNFMRENPDLVAEIEQKVREIHSSVIAAAELGKSGAERQGDGP
jgi:recombination protein RecA